MTTSRRGSNNNNCNEANKNDAVSNESNERQQEEVAVIKGRNNKSKKRNTKQSSLAAAAGEAAGETHEKSILNEDKKPAAEPQRRARNRKKNKSFREENHNRKEPENQIEDSKPAAASTPHRKSHQKKQINHVVTDSKDDDEGRHNKAPPQLYHTKKRKPKKKVYPQQEHESRQVNAQHNGHGDQKKESKQKQQQHQQKQHHQQKHHQQQHRQQHSSSFQRKQPRNYNSRRNNSAPARNKYRPHFPHEKPYSSFRGHNSPMVSQSSWKRSLKSKSAIYTYDISSATSSSSSSPSEGSSSFSVPNRVVSPRVNRRRRIRLSFPSKPTTRAAVVDTRRRPKQENVQGSQRYSRRGHGESTSNRIQQTTIQTKPYKKSHFKTKPKKYLQDSKVKSNSTKTSTKPTKKKELKPIFTPYLPISSLLERYLQKDPTLIRGKLRAPPQHHRDTPSYVSCDRGSVQRDVVVPTLIHRNRALDGDTVYIELISEEEVKIDSALKEMSEHEDEMSIVSSSSSSGEEEGEIMEDDGMPVVTTWRDDEVQMKLWDPMDIKLPPPQPKADLNQEVQLPARKYGRVVHVLPPNSSSAPSAERKATKSNCKFIVGTLKRLRGTICFVPTKKNLPIFFAPRNTPFDENEKEPLLYCAEYVYGSWSDCHLLPKCRNLRQLGNSYNSPDQTLALLIDHGVNHGEFPADALHEVEDAVKSGMVIQNDNDDSDLQWRPTEEMYKGRRDLRSTRIFTIDPTNAKDLDDALHITPMGNDQVEIGVHIADVTHFIQPGSAVDAEAGFRATTVYLVDQTVPMLPRKLCEIACSLNENVERLAFSCIWTMNMDGTLCTDPTSGKRKVWYGKSVIRSCARLDYDTAQNIIERKVAVGEGDDMDETLWPKARRPTGGHTIDDVANDIRLMHKVAMARRQLRMDNGALVLNSIKLTFKLAGDGSVPKLCQPYPIRDSNRLVEEYMLLANYLVAQQLISHARGRAVLRHHPPPLQRGLAAVVDVAKKIGFEIDTTSSQTLSDSLSRLGRECDDELTIQCMTEMLMVPMRPAEYFAAGFFSEEEWRHFALNIPYYTHFTSPIRRYADVLVHRLLSATLEGEGAVENYPFTEEDLNRSALHCNDKRMAAKKAQERSDRVFLSLFLRTYPIESALGIVMSVGEKTFTVFVPSLGVRQKVFLDDHNHLEYTPKKKKKQIVLRPGSENECRWDEMRIEMFAKICVSCRCREKPPLDVSLVVVGPWDG